MYHIGVIFSHSLNYIGYVVSASIMFLLDMMDKIASYRILYSFCFLLGLYRLVRHPQSVRDAIRDVLTPFRDGAVEMWRVLLRAVHLVWSSTSLYGVIQFLVAVTIILHLRNYIFDGYL